MDQELRTDRLILRALIEEDIDSYSKNFVNYEVIRHLSAAVPWPYPTDGVREYVMNHVLPSQGNNRWYWGLFFQTDPTEMIGGVELWRPGTPENRGFWLGEPFWNRGLMTEATGPILDFAFDQLGFDELVLSNAVGNERSRRIKEKTGATFVRTEPADFVDPLYKERELWVLTREDRRAFSNSD